MRSLLRTRHVVLTAAATLALAILAISPGLLGTRVRDALAGISAAEPAWLWAAAAALAAMHACGGLAWGAALHACGAKVGPSDAMARYGIGSGVNAIAPAHLGSALRVGLFARLVEGDGGCWRAGGAGAAVGSVHGVWLALLVALGALSGALPAWPLALIGLGLGAAAAIAVFSCRLTMRTRLGHVLDAFRELGRSPKRLGVVAALTGAGTAMKLAAAASVATAVGVEHPLRAALVVVPALELSAVMPITPGNAGVASAAVALGLGTQHVGADTALAAGIAFAALETLVALAVGVAGALALSGRAVRPFLRVAAAAAASGAVAWAYVATVVL